MDKKFRSFERKKLLSISNEIRRKKLRAKNSENN